MAATSLNPHWMRVTDFQLELSEASQEAYIFQKIRNSLMPQLSSYKGRFFWQVSLAEIHNLVSHDKRVRDVHIYRDFPAGVRLEIEPHTPVMAFFDRDGKFYPVATDATLLPALGSRESPDLPLLRGNEIKSDLHLREQALDLLHAFPEEGPLVSRKKISEIIYSPKDGFRVFVSGAQAEIKMGDTDFGPKVARVQKVLSYLESQDIKGRVIDARFSKKVVVRVRNRP